MVTATTFAELRGLPLTKDRCAGCGHPLLKSDRVTIKVEASRNHQRKTPEWLYRRSVSLCEPCAVKVVMAAYESIG